MNGGVIAFLAGIVAIIVTFIFGHPDLRGAVHGGLPSPQVLPPVKKEIDFD